MWLMTCLTLLLSKVRNYSLVTSLSRFTGWSASRPSAVQSAAQAHLTATTYFKFCPTSTPLDTLPAPGLACFSNRSPGTTPVETVKSNSILTLSISSAVQPFHVPFGPTTADLSISYATRNPGKRTSTTVFLPLFVQQCLRTTIASDSSYPSNTLALLEEH